MQGRKMQSWREENKYHGRLGKSVNPHPKWDLNKIAVIFNPKEQQVLLISENLNLSTDGDAVHSGQLSDRANGVKISQIIISGDKYSAEAKGVCLPLLANRAAVFHFLCYRITGC